MNTLPAVLRARGYRLYSGHGRLVDLWLSGGAAVLGHTPPMQLKELKNSAARGLLSPFGHPLQGRLEKALARLFPGRVCRVYAPGTNFREVLAAAGLDWDPFRRITDPALPGCDPFGGVTFKPSAGPFDSGGEVSLWRPFLDPAAAFAVPQVPVLVPVLPGTPFVGGAVHGYWPPGLNMLAVDAVFEAAHPFPPSDAVAPFILAAAARGVYDLLASARGARGRERFPKIEKALQNSGWRRRGIYLGRESRPAPDEWDAIYNRFLAAGFLIPPDADQPLILPSELSPGEEAALAKMLLP